MSLCYLTLNYENLIQSCSTTYVIRPKLGDYFNKCKTNKPNCKNLIEASVPGYISYVRILNLT